MELFEKDSAFDLAMRGFTQDYILDKTGFDVGYHNAKIKTQMRGIDRMQYRVAFISANYDADFIISVIDEYANGLGKDDVLAKFGVYGDRMVQLKVLFKMLGFLDEFKVADKSFRKLNMKNGTVEKYGVDNVFKLAEIQETAKQTRIDKYGAAYTLCEESSLCETARTTQIEHMKDEGFKESVIEKRKATTMERYGVEHPMQSDDVKAKVKATSLERYGSESYMQSEAGREQASEYMKEHGKEIAAKSKETMRKRYGVNNYSQTKEARKAQSDRMSDYDYYMKTIAAKKRNNTLNTSKPEEELYSMLINYFGIDDVVCQYADEKRYPFNCDFYIPSRDMFIELNAMWTHGGHWFLEDNEYDITKRNQWRTSNKKFYRVAEINWTGYDVEKRKYAKSHSLNYIVLWDASLDDAKLWFAMGCPNGIDWDFEYSWLPRRELYYIKYNELWVQNPRLKVTGTLQSKSYSELYKCGEILPKDASDNDLIWALQRVSLREVGRG